MERAVRLAPADAKPPLAEAHRALTGQLETGVTAYERLVAAAAGYLAEEYRPETEHPAAAASPKPRTSSTASPPPSPNYAPWAAPPRRADRHRLTRGW